MLLTQGYWSPKFCSKIVKNTINEKKNRFLQPEEKKVSTTAFKFNSTAWFHRGPELIKALLDNACDSNKNLRACRRRLSALLWRKDATRLFFFLADAASSCTDPTRQEVRRRNRNGTERPVTFQNKTPCKKLLIPIRHTVGLVYKSGACVCVGIAVYIGWTWWCTNKHSRVWLWRFVIVNYSIDT